MKTRQFTLISISTLIAVCCSGCTSTKGALLGISVTHEPNKTTYLVGESFEYKGMVVKGTYESGKQEKINSYVYYVNDPLEVTDTYVTIAYEGFTTQTSITVVDPNNTTGGTTGGDSTSTGGGQPITEGYYTGIDPTKSSLKQDLHALNSTKRLRTIGYNNLPTNFQKTDPGTATGQVTAFYAGISKAYSGNMNREHVWPDSLGGSTVEGDIHMTRPTLTSDNSDRGNEYYVEGRKGPRYKEKGFDPGMFSSNDITYRGDCARIIFYCAIANLNLTIVDTDGTSKPGNTMGKLSDLLKWNLQYPVQQREQVRNTEAQILQGNRNPFIDHPDYACKIWGSTNSTTRSICGM